MVVPDFLGRQGLSTVDQTFLEVFVNSGMWALIALVIFFFKIYSRISLAFRIQTAERLLIGCLAISLIFRSMTGPTLHEYGFHLFFAVLIISAVLVWSEGGAQIRKNGVAAGVTSSPLFGKFGSAGVGLRNQNGATHREVLDARRLSEF